MIVLLQAIGANFLTNSHLTSIEFRSPGTFGNPNWAASFLLPLAPISISLVGITDNRREKLALNILTIIIIIGTLFTLSKAGSLALVGGIIIFFLLDQRRDPKARLLILLAVIVSAVAVILFAGIKDYFYTFPWIQGRLFLWKAAVILIADHPFSGVGLGGFLPSYPIAAARLINGDPTVFMPLGTINFVHNDPLQIAVEGGLPTAILYLLFVTLVIYTAYIRKEVISLGIGAAIAAMFIYGFADSPLQLPATFMLFWFLIGLVMAGKEDTTLPPNDHNNSKWLSIRLMVIKIVIFIITLLSFIQGVRFIAGNILWTKGIAMLSENHRSGIEALRVATFCLSEIGQVRSDYAKALAHNGRNNEAMKEINTALNLYFNFNDVFFRLNLLEKISDLNTVIDEWQRLSMKFPSLLTPHYRLGSIYLSRGDVASATKEFQKVLESNQQTRQAELYQEKTRQILKIINDGYYDNMSGKTRRK